MSSEASVGDLASHGRLDILFDNAGIGPRAGTDEAGWWRVVDVNRTGVSPGRRHGAPTMWHTRGGTVIGPVSRAGALRPGRVYGARKAAAHA